MFDSPISRKILADQSGYLVESDQSTGRQLISIYTPLPKYGWGLIISQPTESFFVVRQNNLQSLLLLYGFLWLFLAGLAYLIISILKLVKSSVDRSV